MDEQQVLPSTWMDLKDVLLHHQKNYERVYNLCFYL